ncbi:MAG: hypothetical protein GXP58_09850 [Deltaproteobacteria bacterium]|nr:hypothetical protein [Deltaproteobacteria bacterium]
MEYPIERIFLEAGVETLPVTQEIVARFPGLPAEIVDEPDPIFRPLLQEGDPQGAGKQVLFLSSFPGAFVKKCPGTQGFICCNYTVLNAATGCPLDCTYCILQLYLRNNPILRIFVNTGEILSRLETLFAARPGRIFRIGTGELTDSLALDPLTGLSRELVPFFARQTNALLELKTKTDHIENLLDLDPRGRTVIGWSVNPEAIITAEERGAASLTDRLLAAKRCRAAGYKIAFHFDPMILDEGWEGAYSGVVEAIMRSVDPEGIAWISLGGLRFPPALKEIMRERFPESPIVTGEFIPCPDGKMRYLRSIRVPAYRKMVEWIRSYGSKVPVYLCMESREVWERVFASAPPGIENLSGIFR